MSYDLAIWKRSPTTKTAMLAEAYQALCNDEVHPAIGEFDTAELADALQTVLRDVDSALVYLTSSGSDGVFVHSGFSDAERVRDLVLDPALVRELMVYDPQRRVVWGNKRPPKAAPGRQGRP